MTNLIEELELAYELVGETEEKVKAELNAIGIRKAHEYEPYSFYLQYGTGSFFEKFNNFIVKRDEDDMFPFKASEGVGNVVHFTIFSQEEYDYYVDLGVIK